MSSEFWRSVAAVRVESIEYSKLATTTKGVPFAGNLKEVFSVLGDEKIRLEEDGEKDPYLIRISDSHGRSFVYPFLKVWWEDEYGHLYLYITSKGNDVTEQCINKVRISPSGFDSQGLQDHHSLTRIIAASNFLRRKGIKTEAIIAIYKLYQLPGKEGFTSIEDYKRELLEAMWEADNPYRNPQNRSTRVPISRKDFPEALKAVEGWTFFLTVRALPVPHRIRDLAYINNKEEFEKVMEDVFEYVNKSQERGIAKINRRRKKNIEQPLHYDVNNPEDIIYFFTKHLPYRMAFKLGKMHKAGVVHGFPHPGNWVLTGDPVDTDSVRGEPLKLGDKPITDADKGNDLSPLYFDAYKDVFQKLKEIGVINKNIDDIETDFDRSINGGYKAAVGGDWRTTTRLRTALYLTIHTVKKMSKAIPFKYELGVSKEEVMQSFLEVDHANLAECIEHAKEEGADNQDILGLIYTFRAQGAPIERFESYFEEIVEEIVKAKYKEEIAELTKQHGEGVVDGYLFRLVTNALMDFEDSLSPSDVRSLDNRAYKQITELATKYKRRAH